jgi:hypothetical protein
VILSLAHVSGLADFLSLISLNQELAYVKANNDTLVGFTVWAAGAFDASYILSVTPNSDGTNQPLWTQAGKSVLNHHMVCTEYLYEVIPNLP